MPIEHELVDTIDFENVINDFVSQKARNLRLTFLQYFLPKSNVITNFTLYP